MKFKSNIELQAGLEDNNATSGTSGQVLSSTGTGVEWIDQNAISASSNFVYFEVKNETGSTINKGKGVMAVGTDGNSGHILIDEMVADGSVESKYFLGVLETTVANGGFARVISFGQLDQFDTRGQNGETWLDGQVLWCDPDSAGDFTITEPDGPNVKIAAAFILNASTNGKIQVRVQANEGIHDLHDTRITSQVDGDVLVWDNTDGVWFNDSTLNVDYTNSRVGIGTTSPGYKLHVLDSSPTLSIQSNTTYPSSYIDFRNISNSLVSRIFSYSNPVEAGLDLSYEAFGIAANSSKIQLKSGLIYLHTAGSSRVTVNSSGNVGIGTTSPSYKLDVTGTARIKDAANPLIYFGRTNTVNSGIGMTSDNILRFAVGTAGLGTDTKMVINSSGNVGIGTTSPNEKLEVAGNTRITGNGLDVGYNNNGTNYIQVGNGRTTDGYAFIDLVGDSTYSDHGLRIIRNNTGANTSSEILHRGTGALNLNATQAGYITLKTNNTERVRIDSSGNVGIGTTSPSQKLTISGTDQYVATQHATYTWGGNETIGLRMGTDATAGILDFRRWIGGGQTHGTALITQVSSDGGYGLDFRVDTKSTNTAATTSRMFLSTSGEVGIGTTSPQYKLDVNGEGKVNSKFRVGGAVMLAEPGTGVLLFGSEGGSQTAIYSASQERIRINSTGNVGIGTTSPAYQLQLSLNSAAKPASNVWTVVSDLRVKENIRPYTSGLNEVLQIEPKLFDYNGKAGFEKTKDNIGIIAQDMINIMPETINTYQEKLNEDDEDKTELYNFDGHAITFALINSIKELQQQITDLKTEIETLKNK